MKRCIARWALVAAVAGLLSAGSAAYSAGPGGPLVLARDGKALAPIVVARTSGVAGFAARELKHYLDRVTGATFRIVEKTSRSPRIFVGDCAAARAAGLDVSALKRDGFYRAVVGDDLFLLGRDHGGRWVLNLHDYQEHATLYAVYDFLEDLCGVRWFKSGPYGEVVPTKAALSVAREILKEGPAFVDRRVNQISLHHYRYGDAAKHSTKVLRGAREPQRELWALRQRYATSNAVAGCHSVTYLKFAERFGKTHPEWFSLRTDGTRAIKTGYGEHLCWSQPGVVREFIKDARAYFTGKSPRTRGLKTFHPAGFQNTFMVDPSDGYTPCRCDLCRKALQAHPAQGYSEIIFRAVARVAEGVKDLKGKYITTLAYGPKKKPPQSFRLPANVRVRLCTNGPSLHALPGSRAKQLARIEQWSGRMKGGLVLWVYTNAAWYHGSLKGAVETMPRLIARFLKDSSPYIQGVFFENEANNHTLRFFDEYIILKLLWDPHQDVDALIEDYFTKFYGPAAGPMKAFYARLEQMWLQVCTFYGGDEARFVGRIDLWDKIYSKAAMAELDAMLKEADRKAAGDEAVSWRVDLIRRHVYRSVAGSRKGFEKILGLAKDIRLACRRAPSAPEKATGLLTESAWAHVGWQRLEPSQSTKKLSVQTRFRALYY